MDTQTAKPNASVDQNTASLVYCIRHEQMVALETCDGKEGHTFVNGGWDREVDYCTFPDGYAFVAPPEMPPHIADEMLDTGDWAAQEEPDDGDMCADEVGAWED